VSPVFRVCRTWAVSWAVSSTRSAASFRVCPVFRRFLVLRVFRRCRVFRISAVWQGGSSILSAV
jgi:hypothetical protein